MTHLSDIKFSTLDLVPVREGGSAAQSLHNSLDLAQHVEKFGYHRFWVAEHHNLDGIASSATAVLIGYLAPYPSPADPDTDDATKKASA